MGLLARIESGGVFARTTAPSRDDYSNWSFRVPQIPGIRLDHYTALGVAAHFACVQVISKNIAQCPWDIVAEQPNGDWEYKPLAPAWRIFNIQGNAEMTAQAMKEQLMLVALLWGESYAEIEWDMANRPKYLWPLEPERCCKERDPITGRKVLRVKNYSREDTILDWSNIYAITGPGIGFYSFDMVVLASRVLAQALASQQFGLKFYEHGTAMGGVFSTDQPNVTQEKLDALRKQIEEKGTGPENAFKFLLLSGGLKYYPNNQSLRDAQANENYHLLIEEICRFYGVPPHKVQHLLRATFSNIEHQGLEYTRDTLARWARGAEQEAAIKLLGKPSLRLQIDMDELAEGDAKSIAETDSILVNSGLRRRNEMRRKRGWNSYGPVGDVITVQGAMTTLEAVQHAPAPRRNGGGDLPPSEDDENRAHTAAVAIYANALKRAMRRQLRRAENIAGSAQTQKDFLERVESYQSEQLEYVHDQLGEALRVVHSIGMNGNSAAVRAEVSRRFAEEKDLLAAAFSRRELAAWCDIDRRAESIARALVEVR